MTFNSANIPSSLSTIARNNGSRINAIEHLNLLTKENPFSGTSPGDEKSKVIVNKLGDENPNPQTDFRFQINTPVAKLLELIKSHNETNKTSLNDEQENELDEFAEFTEIEEADGEKDEGIGFYIVLGDTPSKSIKLLPKTKFDLVRERIVQTYHSSVRKSNGSLVNLTI